MATQLVELPVELWDSIFARLMLPDLKATSLASKYLNGVVQTRLKEHQQFHRDFKILRADNLYEHGLVIHWFNPLVKILRNPTLGFYVQELDTDLAQNSPTLGSYQVACENEGREFAITDADMDLVKEAGLVCASDWFYILEHPNYKTAFLDDVNRLEQSALLAILLCLLPNLRVLTLTANCWGGLEDAHWLQLLAERVHCRPEGPLLGGTPFSKLEHVKGDIFNGNYGLDFETIQDFIAIPTVRWLETPRNHEEGFDWPAYLPRSNIREIVLNGCTIPKEAITKFASQALRGPCIIRQSWGERRHDSTPEPTWTSLEVPFQDAKEDDFIFHLNEALMDYNYEDMTWLVKPGN